MACHTAWTQSLPGSSWNSSFSVPSLMVSTLKLISIFMGQDWSSLCHCLGTCRSENHTLCLGGKAVQHVSCFSSLGLGFGKQSTVGCENTVTEAWQGLHDPPPHRLVKPGVCVSVQAEDHKTSSISTNDLGPRLTTQRRPTCIPCCLLSSKMCSGT